MKQDQHSFDNAIFSFNYESKSVALRCSNVIETMFDSQILPEMDHAISNIIPDEILTQIDTLDIDIGTLNEKEIPIALPRLIKVALENALHEQLKFKEHSGIANSTNDQSANYLLGAVEFYLLRGFFPTWVNRETSFDQIINQLLKASSNDLVLILNKYRDNEPLISRLSFNIESKTFQSLVYAISSVNHKWILDFRNRLDAIENRKGIASFGLNGTIQFTNSFILISLLRMSTSTFNKATFIEYVISCYISRFSVSPKELLSAFQAANDGSDITTLIVKTSSLQDHQKGENNNILVLEFYLRRGCFPSWMNSDTSINQILIYLIKESKKDVIALLRKYNEQDSILSHMFFGLDSKVFESLVYAIYGVNYKWILDFRNRLETLEDKAVLLDLSPYSSLQFANSFILMALLKMPPDAFHKMNFVKYVMSLYISRISGKHEILLGAFERTNDGSEISTLIIESILQQDSQSSKGVNSKADDDFLIKQFISNINKIDLLSNTNYSRYNKKQLLWFIKNERTRALLTENLNVNGVIGILNQFYRKDSKALFDFINSFICTFKRIIDLRGEKFLVSIQGLALASILYLEEKSDQNIDYNNFFVFLVIISGFKKDAITNNSAITDFVESQGLLKQREIDRINDSKKSSKLISSLSKSVLKDLGAQSEIENELYLESNTSYKAIDIYRRKIIMHYLDFGFLPKEFRNLGQSDVQGLFNELILQKDSFLADKCRTLGRKISLYERIVYLIHDDSWEALNAYLKYHFNEIIYFFQEIIYNSNNKNDKETTHHLKNQLFNKEVLLSLVLNKKEYFDAFYNALNSSKVKLELNNEFNELDGYLSALKSFTPKWLSPNIDSNFWPKLVMRFTIQLKLGGKRHTQLTIAKAFIYYYNEEVHSSNKRELLIQIMNEMKHSENDTLNKFSSALQNINNREKIDSKIKDIKSSTNKNLVVLGFYAHNGFFPWWTEKKSLSELMNTILDESQSLGKGFETICLEVEAENKFIKPLISKLSANLIAVFSLLSSKYTKLNRIWKDSLYEANSIDSVKYKDTDEHLKKTPSKSIVNQASFGIENYLEEGQLQRTIYFFKDEEILDQLFQGDRLKKEQLRPYLKLAPYLYFQEINPSKWRILIYNFALDYFKLNEHLPNQEFHSSFLKFMQQTHKNTPWKEVFTAIYKKTQIIESKPVEVLPQEILTFIGLEPGMDKELNMQSIESNNDDGIQDVGAEIRIYNAGLIIVWPFLTRYFEQLFIVENGEFRDEESRNRSIFLLQQLVYNQIDFPEYELVLNKVLVGFPLAKHLSPISALTIDEKNLAVSLLNGLKSNWDKVKNSSIEGVQETFIQREGLLKIKEERFELVIEKKGVDALIDSLSWNISLIKLPWMQKPLYIEWI